MFEIEPEIMIFDITSVRTQGHPKLPCVQCGPGGRLLKQANSVDTSQPDRQRVGLTGRSDPGMVFKAARTKSEVAASKHRSTFNLGQNSTLLSTIFVVIRSLSLNTNQSKDSRHELFTMENW